MASGEILCHDRSKFIEWKVDKFSSRLKRECYCFISPEFRFLGASWRLRFVPNNARDPTWASMYLVRDHSETSQYFVTVHVGMKKEDDTPYALRSFQYNNSGNRWWQGIHRFEQMGTLLRDMNELAPNDQATYFCYLQSTRYGYSQAETQTSQLEGVEKLTRDFRSLLINGKDADTIIQVESNEFRKHCLVLVTRCPAAVRMLSQNAQERSTGAVQIAESDTDAVREFLFYLYSGKLKNISPNNVIELYQLAYKYDAKEVTSECIKFLTKELSVDKFCDVIDLAMKHNESHLMEVASDFFVKNVKKIIVTSKWQTFHKEYPMESNELHIKAIDYLSPNA